MCNYFLHSNFLAPTPTQTPEQIVAPLPPARNPSSHHPFTLFYRPLVTRVSTLWHPLITPLIPLVTPWRLLVPTLAAPCRPGDKGLKR